MGRRIRGRGWAGLIAVLLTAPLVGCTTGRTASLGGPPPGSLQLADLAPPPIAGILLADHDAPPIGGSSQLADLDRPPIARSQLPDNSTPPARSTEPKPTVALPAPPTNLLPGANPILPVSGTLGTSQVAALLDGSKLSVKVRVWVNGHAVFDDELRQLVLPALAGIERLSEPQRSEKLAELYNTAIERVIDEEVMYQDAVKKIEKHDPKSMAKLKQHVNEEYEKRLKRMREAGVPEDQIQALGHTAKRLLEREMISSIYARNRVMGYITQQVTLEQIKAYYELHKDEFKTIDRVQWEDVFIAVGPKHPSPAEARHFAEDLIAKCRTPDDFAKLQVYDEGDSKLRGGKGFGEKQGEVRPPELEPYLFRMQEGQIGPVVELPTGVHVFRLTKRERAGFAPMNDQTQKAIRTRLENQLFERELKQLVRELRERSVIRVVRE
jgi:hypothetical protein